MLGLQLLQPLDRGFAQESTTVRRSHHGTVQGCDHIPSRVVAAQFGHDGTGNLFGCDQLHLTERGDGRKLAGGELPILAGVYVYALQCLACCVTEITLLNEIRGVSR